MGLRSQLISEIFASPARLAAVVEGLSEAQLDTRDRNSTVRQIVHHVADSRLIAISTSNGRWQKTPDHHGK
jgi:hypothetical protein